jgi:inorganic pyrophosphatase
MSASPRCSSVIAGMSEIVSLWGRDARRIARAMKQVMLMLMLCVVGCWRDDVPRRQIVAGAPVTPSARALDGDTIAGREHLSRGYPARNPDGSINAVVEIPSGTTAKWEVDDDDGRMRWARRREDGVRREIDYLPYPINYGMVPGTLAPDGDALDIFVLGRGIERAHVAATKLIGVLEMAHDDVRDDKLSELDERDPATRTILELWFSHYWGKGATRVVGWGNAATARKILDEAIERVTPRLAAHSARPDRADPRPRAASPCAVLAGSLLPRALRAVFDSAY